MASNWVNRRNHCDDKRATTSRRGEPHGNPDAPPTGIERKFGEDEIIINETDTQGCITYANNVFLRTSGFTEDEVLSEPLDIIRHPDTPRCVFKLLWDTLQSCKEISADVINLAKNGDHYWVLAHLPPTFDDSGRIVSYHSTGVYLVLRRSQK